MPEKSACGCTLVCDGHKLALHDVAALSTALVDVIEGIERDNKLDIETRSSLLAAARRGLRHARVGVGRKQKGERT